MIFTAVTTAPRPNPTIEHCLASMRAAGFDRVHVLSDGGYESGDLVMVNNPPLGGFRNWCRALELGIKSRLEWVLIVEDDTLWAKNAFIEMMRDLPKLDDDSFGYLSLFTCRRVSTHIESRFVVKRGTLPAGIYEARLGWSTWGSQALLLSRESAIALNNDQSFIDYRDNYTKNRNRDAIVSKCFMAMGRKTLFRIPSLVSHELGQGNSSLGPKPEQSGLITDYPSC